METNNSTTSVAVIILTASLGISMDNGSIPALTDEIKEIMGFNELEVGGLGSIFYIGLIIGTLLSGYAYYRFSAKTILTTCCALTGITIACFPYSKY
jgi:MFS family permease